MFMHGTFVSGIAKLEAHDVLSAVVFLCLLVICVKITSIAVHAFATWMKVGE